MISIYFWLVVTVLIHSPFHMPQETISASTLALRESLIAEQTAATASLASLTVPAGCNRTAAMEYVFVVSIWCLSRGTTYVVASTETSAVRYSVMATGSPTSCAWCFCTCPTGLLCYQHASNCRQSMSSTVLSLALCCAQLFWVG